MKLLCIKQGTWRGTLSGVIQRGPIYGEECIVTGIYNDTYYFLKGYSENFPFHSYDKKWFVEIESEVDEMELVNDNQLVNQ